MQREQETKQDNPIIGQELTDEYMEELRNRAIEKAQHAIHEWRQKGSWIYCKTCPFEHGFDVGTRKTLIGIKDGKPILKNRR